MMIINNYNYYNNLIDDDDDDDDDDDEDQNGHIDDKDNVRNDAPMLRSFKPVTKAMTAKRSLENKHLGNGDYFVINLLLPRILYYRAHCKQMDW